MNNCVFCKIIKGEIPSSKVYEDDLCLAFRDIDPQAKEHILAIPKEHISSLDGAGQEHDALLGHLMLVCARVARERGIAAEGYRIASNVGAHGCQSEKHLHIHILGGEQLLPRLG